jgi:acyl carrier protein
MITNIPNFQQDPKSDTPTARDINTVKQRKARMPTTTIDEVRRFLIANWRAKENQIVPSTRLLHDLGIDADDAAEILAAFSEKFSVDLSSFPFSMHFGSEADAGFPMDSPKNPRKRCHTASASHAPRISGLGESGPMVPCQREKPDQISEVNGQSEK